ncbi:ATP-binding protein [Pedobacter terrae]|uniref:ATP-binding protein n=1 Tax=Pedobacter terrae TaxID=405671 RepID=UPI002FFA74B9
MSKVDLTTCDDEPIHIPGAIQGHGFLLAFNEQLYLSYYSENFSTITGYNLSGYLGKSMSDTDVLDEKQDGGLYSMLKFFRTQSTSNGSVQFNGMINGKAYNIILNYYNSHYIFDFEPAGSDLQQSLHGHIGKSLSEMLSDKKLSRLLGNAAQQVQQIIGYDRVMIYKFHIDGHGEVVAETKNDNLESWMGLHYPASDIPKQARELYRINIVRLIADVWDEPSALLTKSRDGKAIPLDLTYSTLRAVSPMHIQYLKNMGVASSFSISIMNHDQLWGLIACHNYTPRFINYGQRESAKLVGQVLSSAISFREQEEEQYAGNQHRTAIETITRYLLRNIAVEQALFNEDTSLVEVVPATGTVLYYNGEFHSRGNIPDDEFMERLMDWLHQKTTSEGYYATNELPNEFSRAKEMQHNFSGLLACRLGKDLREYMLWFRPEAIKKVTWAGDPAKQITRDEKGFTHISPRNSFKEWTQEVSGKSEVWKQHEITAVLALRDEVNYAINRKATELRVIHEQLRLAYAELDTFSYTISHDLKNPLATIKAFAQLIQRANLMDAEKVITIGKKIENGAAKMQIMIEEVLQYSKVGQSKIQGKAINMQKMLDEIRHDLMVSSGADNLVIDIQDTPDLFGDQLMIFQVFSNVVGNAVKYSGHSAYPFVSINGKMFENKVVYSITDNGIGIAKEDIGKVFELFTRAKETHGIEGTGVGLAIAKRIMDKHNGEILIDSEPGKGSTFLLSFNRLEHIHGIN